MAEEVIKLAELKKEDVPADLRAETYFDFEAYPFEHQALLEQTNSVPGAIYAINEYATKWLTDKITDKRPSSRALKNEVSNNAYTTGQFEILLEEDAVFEPTCVIGSRQEGICHSILVAKGANVVGANIYLDKGSIYIGEETTIEYGAGIKGPTIIGKRSEIRQDAYLRGDCIIGNDATIRGEIKNSVLMDKANFPHPSYQGDSICGYMTHFASGAGTANVSIYGGLVNAADRKSLTVKCDGKIYDLGRPKMGLCMGDFSQFGGSSISDPGTFVKPCTITYLLTRISKGFYGPSEILKNKPLEHGVIERVPLREE